MTSKQYAKHAMPESIVKNIKLSMSFRRAGVSSLYACHDCAIAFEADCVTLAGDIVDVLEVAPAGFRGTLFGAIAYSCLLPDRLILVWVNASLYPGRSHLGVQRARE